MSPECLSERDSLLHISEQRTGSPEDNSMLPKKKCSMGSQRDTTECVHAHTHTRITGESRGLFPEEQINTS